MATCGIEGGAEARHHPLQGWAPRKANLAPWRPGVLKVGRLTGGQWSGGLKEGTRAA